jgi:hypothetical protein
MVSDARKKMLEKVKAILAKTMDNGCTEEEAMAALAKAKELMATYELTEADIEASEQEQAIYHKTDMRDPYDIKERLYTAVGNFTRCKGVNGRKKNYGISFAGLESDVIFATWLLDTLQRFIMRALRDFQKERAVKRIPNSNYTSASFVVGCQERIKEKLEALTMKMPAKNQEIIAAVLAQNGVVLRKYNVRGIEIDRNAYGKGHAAGNSARFDRPVEQGGIKRLK